MSIQPLWLTHFIEILLVLEFQLTKCIVGAFSYNVHLDPKFPLMTIASQSNEIRTAGHGGIAQSTRTGVDVFFNQR